MFSTATPFSLFYLLIELLAIASALHALWNVRTTQATIAWVVSLISMPIIVLPLYWIFGRYRFYGYRESIREVGLLHKRSVAAIERELRTEPNSATTSLQTPLDKLADVLDTPICDGNSCELLIDGEAFYHEVERVIESAKKYLYIEFYIVRDDEVGNRVANALIAAAQRNVVVRFVYDEIGSMKLSSDYINRLSSHGVDVRSFNTRRGPANPFQLNFRNHRKIIVADGQTAIIGGFNLGNEYLGKASWTDHWRDTAVSLVGPIVTKVQAVYAGDYYWAARKDLPEAVWSRGKGAGKDLAQEHQAQNDLQQGQALSNTARAALCVTGPADTLPRATMMFATVASAAKTRLWISTPYLVPDDMCVIALAMARARGVDVRILLPSIPDAWSVFLAGFYYERELLTAGVATYRYQPGAMHCKCVLVDGDLALIGSTNLDNRSLHLNFEMMAAIEQPEFVAQVARMLEHDFERSIASNLGETVHHRWKYRFGRIVARLFSPVL